MTRTRSYSNAVRTDRARHFAARIACAADRRRRREAVEGLLAPGDITASEAAHLPGVHRSTILRRCKALGINPKQARAALPITLRREVRGAIRDYVHQRRAKVAQPQYLT
jgi:hypothetical protein